MPLTTPRQAFLSAGAVYVRIVQMSRNPTFCEMRDALPSKLLTNPFHRDLNFGGRLV